VRPPLPGVVQAGIGASPGTWTRVTPAGGCQSNTQTPSAWVTIRAWQGAGQLGHGGHRAAGALGLHAVGGEHDEPDVLPVDRLVPGPEQDADVGAVGEAPDHPWDTITSAEPGISGSIRVRVAAAPAGTFSHWAGVRAPHTTAQPMAWPTTKTVTVRPTQRRRWVSQVSTPTVATGRKT